MSDYEVYAPSEEWMIHYAEEMVKAAITVTPGRRFARPFSIIIRGKSVVLLDTTCFPVCIVQFDDEDPNKASEAQAREIAQAIGELPYLETEGMLYAR